MFMHRPGTSSHPYTFSELTPFSHNWQLMSHGIGCGSVSVTIATAYDTLGEEGFAHSLDEPESACSPIPKS